MKTFKKALLAVLGIILVVILFGFLYLGIYLPNAEPVRDLVVEITPEKVERGRYLANHVSVCMDCHAERDWSRFAGPPHEETIGAGGDRFGRDMGLPGEVYAQNLTPTNLVKYTDGELFRVITTGVSHEKKVLFPIMPFSSYSHLAEEDVIALIAYLRTLEPVERNFPATVLDFPVNFLINTMSHEYKGGEIPDRSDRIAYGKYVTTIAACADCHHPGTHGNLDYSRPYAGGLAFDLPGLTVRAANITPDIETGIGNWDLEYFITRFKMYDPEVNGFQAAEPGSFNTAMPWTMYAGMTQDDLSAIYDYLQSLKPIKHSFDRVEFHN